jgi:hypothetical protein
MGSIHPEAKRVLNQHPGAEHVVQPLLCAFSVTTVIPSTRPGSSTLGFYLKPEPFMAEFLGIERELLLVYSPHKELQARDVDFHDFLLHSDRSRLDPLGSIVVSAAPNMNAFLADFLAKDKDRPPIMTLSVSELAAVSHANDLRALFSQQFFRRDVFGLESPLTRDRTFFGRQVIVTELLDQFRSGQNAGLFGLRRMGKTSVLYALKRRCADGGIATFCYVDLSNPSHHKLRWRDLLQTIIKEIADCLPQESALRSLDAQRMSYSEERAASRFEKDIKAILTVAVSGRIVLALDEVENIACADLSPDAHWNDDFLPFWQTMRAVHQKLEGQFSFIVAGVNPHPLEMDQVGGFDNPLFSTARLYYLPPFELPQVRDMVRQLSRFMGISVDEGLYGRLTADFGGHPYLIRQVCSYLCKQLTDRPTTLALTHYEREEQPLRLALEKNVRQILSVLARYYPSEYEGIRLLAHGEVDRFKALALENAELTRHVEGYGLVAGARSSPGIRIGVVLEHLAGMKTPQEMAAKSSDVDDVWAEVSRRRNPIERKLREVGQLGCRFSYGPKAASRVLSHIPSERREVLARFGYEELWGELFLKELADILRAEWNCFQQYFTVTPAEFFQWLDQVNRFRPDAHAREVDDEELAYTRVCLGRLEEKLDLL